jgi:hypothetical protein
MTSKQADALARMQAANAALTPEERKARSAAAAAASKAAQQARKKGGGDGDRPTSTTQARVEPEIVHTWHVLLLTDAGLRWHKCTAGGPQRACRLARKANEGAMVRGVIRADVGGPLPERK